MVYHQVQKKSALQQEFLIPFLSNLPGIFSLFGRVPPLSRGSGSGSGRGRGR